MHFAENANVRDLHKSAIADCQPPHYQRTFGIIRLSLLTHGQGHTQKFRTRDHFPHQAHVIYTLTQNIDIKKQKQQSLFAFLGKIVHFLKAIILHHKITKLHLALTMKQGTVRMNLFRIWCKNEK